MYKKSLHIHFVGIGGIGMSGIATILAKQGYAISGCDTDITQKSVQTLKQIGCTIYHGNNTPGCCDQTISILVYSSAIQETNEEITTARARGIPTIPRAVMLAELMRTKYSIAIAGSHGKTTTTSMLSHILLTAQYDPTVIIGGHLKTISHNAHYGVGDFLVAEADESDRSLLHLHATLALITNIDLEHLETYHSLDDITKTFLQFLSNIPFYGKAHICIDDPIAASLLPLPHLRVETYGFNPQAHTSAYNLSLNAQTSSFQVVDQHKRELGSVTINMPGKHNAQNALGALSLAQELGVPFATIAHALSTFPGIDRRFSYHGTYKGAELFDDYGHHPQEIVNTLSVAQMRTKQNLTVIFQPHRYTRTKFLWKEFVETFATSKLNHLIITDIYAASEQPLEGISSQDLVKAIQQQNPPFTIQYIPYQENHLLLRQALDKTIQEHDLILLLGAGKVHTMAQTLLALSLP